MNLIITVREKGDSEIYTPIGEHALRVETRVVSEETGISKVQVTVGAEEDFEGVIKFALPVAGNDMDVSAAGGSETKEPVRFFLPGFMYGTNRGDAPLVVDSACPRLRVNGGYPSSSWWMVRSDRLSHPCAFAHHDGRLTGLSGSPFIVRTPERTGWKPSVQGTFDQYTGFGCSIYPAELYYTLGYENAPLFFLDSHHIKERAQLDENCFRLSKGESFTFMLTVYGADEDKPGLKIQNRDDSVYIKDPGSDNENDHSRRDERLLHDALKHVYQEYHEQPRQSGSIKEAVAAIATAISRDAWLPGKHSYAGFVFDREGNSDTQPMPGRTGEHLEYRLLPSITWTNGLSAALPMLMSACRLGNEEMKTQALGCIENIVSHSMNPDSGLPWLTEKDGVWSNRGWWYDKQRNPGHAAYLVGQSVYYILKAYEWEKNKNDTTHDDWLEFAGKVISRTEQSRNADGEYPYIFSEKTGAGLEYDSFSGAWCMAAAAYYSYLTGERKYITQLLKSMEWYHDTYIRHVQCWGGPLDIDKNMDSEGILAYIRAARYIHEITGDETILEHMRDALYYEFTFKFCYNSRIKVPPLSVVGWSSCGGSITSVTNPHIHPMSSSVIDEMLYYLQQRDDPYIRSRMEDTILWSCQCHNTYDGEYGYGLKGWMSERFCHSEGLLTERYTDGSPASTWFALMPWAAGSLLEGLTGEAWEGR